MNVTLHRWIPPVVLDWRKAQCTARRSAQIGRPAFEAWWRTAPTHDPVLGRMVDDFLASASAGRVSKYWWYLAQTILTELETHGYDQFKQTIAPHYFTAVDTIRGDEPAYRTLLQAYVRQEAWPLYPEPGEGGALHVYTQDLLHSAVEYGTLRRTVPVEEIETVLELGGGYGRTAWYLTQAHPDWQYTIYDIPPCLYLADRYLRTHAPTVACRPIEALEDVPDQSIDLALAFDCLHAMPLETVRYYLDQLDRIATRVVWTVWPGMPMPFDGITHDVARWPIPAHWRGEGEQALLVPPGYRMVTYRTRP